MSDEKKELGPIYGVELIGSLPLNCKQTSGMNQAMPSKSDLHRAHVLNGRLVAGYEVLLNHWREQGKEIERLEAIVNQLPRTGDGVVVAPGRKGIVTYCNERQPHPHHWQIRLKSGQSYESHCYMSDERHYSTPELAAEAFAEKEQSGGE